MVAYISIETALRIVETAYLVSAIFLVAASYIAGTMIESWEKNENLGKYQQ
jgi:hypothetical protein